MKMALSAQEIYSQHFASRGRTDLPVDHRRAIFVAGDDEDAKQVVKRLIAVESLVHAYGQ